MILHPLKTADRGAELHARVAVGHGHVEHPSHLIGGGHHARDCQSVVERPTPVDSRCHIVGVVAFSRVVRVQVTPKVTTKDDRRGDASAAGAYRFGRGVRHPVQPQLHQHSPRMLSQPRGR